MKSNVTWFVLGLMAYHSFSGQRTVPIAIQEEEVDTKDVNSPSTAPTTPASTKGVSTSTKNNSDITTSSHIQNCQIIYLVGLEGSSHHGSSDVLKAFASQQVDSSGQPYGVHYRSATFRSIVQFDHQKLQISSEGRRSGMNRLCPDDGRHHVILEDTSFPSGFGRRRDWKNLNSTQIASDMARNPNPLNLIDFVDQFSEFARVQVLVLHRPFANTVVSRHTFDPSVQVHAHIEAGTALYLANHVFAHPEFPDWSLVCVDHFKQRNNNPNLSTDAAIPRAQTFQRLADYLQWPQSDCPHCFDHWRDSNKDPKEMVTDEEYQTILALRQQLMPLWPPRPQSGKEIENCAL